MSILSIVSKAGITIDDKIVKDVSTVIPIPDVAVIVLGYTGKWPINKVLDQLIFTFKPIKSIDDTKEYRNIGLQNNRNEITYNWRHCEDYNMCIYDKYGIAVARISRYYYNSNSMTYDGRLGFNKEDIRSFSSNIRALDSSIIQEN